jgi:thiamine pyrophosphokinase
MSSHHLVRDKQEPALIIANGTQCGSELLGQLLEWSPFIVVLDGALERVSHLKIKFDVVLGDFDSADLSSIEQYQDHVRIVQTPDQSKTDLQKGIEFLIEEGFDAVNIIWATGKRADHTFNNICTIGWFKDRINCVMLDDYSKVFPLPNFYTKHYEMGSIISLIPLGHVYGVKTKGLKYNLNDETLSATERTGSSNETLEKGLIQIEYKEGILLLMECLD